MNTQLRYPRVLLKLSGEAFGGKQGHGFDFAVVQYVANQIASAHKLGASIGVVVGGGNFIRGEQLEEAGLDRNDGDQMGMLATIINAKALASALTDYGLEPRVMSALRIDPVAEPFIRARAIRHLEKGRVLVFGGGTGNPFFTTDTAAALRAMEIEADALFMSKNKANGVFNKDPNKYPDAFFIKKLSYMEVLNRGLDVMDSSALTMCKDHEMPIIVFDLMIPGSLCRAILGEPVGTLICSQ